MTDSDAKSKKVDRFAANFDDDAMSVYDEDPPVAAQEPDIKRKVREQDQTLTLPPDAQDVFFERREPPEAVFCFLLACAYAGLVRYLWEPLQESGQWQQFITVEGLFVTLSLLSLALAVRPMFSPTSLQISTTGIKYRGPYWPQRKSITWAQMFRLYLCPDMIVILYRPSNKPRAARILFIQCNYLSDPKQILTRFSKYSPVSPIYLRSPEWYMKLIFLIGYMSLVCWIIYSLAHGTAGGVSLIL